jgi:hypothetical protein
VADRFQRCLGGLEAISLLNNQRRTILFLQRLLNKISLSCYSGYILSVPPYRYSNAKSLVIVQALENSHHTPIKPYLPSASEHRTDEFLPRGLYQGCLDRLHKPAPHNHHLIATTLTPQQLFLTLLPSSEPAASMTHLPAVAETHRRDRIYYQRYASPRRSQTYTLSGSRLLA